MILPVLREVALRGCYATAVEALTFLYPTIYGVLAPTKPLNEDTVRRWYELGSYTKLKPTYREALVRQRGAYLSLATAAAAACSWTTLQYSSRSSRSSRTSAVPASLSMLHRPRRHPRRAGAGPARAGEREVPLQHHLGPRLRVRPAEMGHKLRACPHCRTGSACRMLPASGRQTGWCLPECVLMHVLNLLHMLPAGASPVIRNTCRCTRRSWWRT